MARGTATSLFPSFSDRFRVWREAFLTGNVSEERPVDRVARWLVITRASVLPMTLTSGLLGGILALGVPGGHWGYFLLCLSGLVTAHVANNLMNDYFDLAAGVDTEDYPRALYAPHPVLSGWISREGLLGAIVVCNVAGLAILVALAVFRGWPIVAFAAAGFLISVFYVAPPIRLKHHGLGEPAVFLVWGPLMVAGTFYATAGTLPGWVWAASLPYGVLVMTVLIGKHVDKLPYDAPKGVRTLPVLLGEERALWLNQLLMVAFYVMVFGLVVAGTLTPWILLSFLALPQLFRVLGAYGEPRPEEPPRNYPVWPLWYVAFAFVHTRKAGGLFILGLLIDRLLAW